MLYLEVTTLFVETTRQLNGHFNALTVYIKHNLKKVRV